jgi:hypothetical protein
MLPTAEQIQWAAYFRWKRRNGEHGRDRDDWLASEQDLLFTRNYEVVARFQLDREGAQFVGNKERRRCRFCELAPPQASFKAIPPVIPEYLGNKALFAYDQCDECQGSFAEMIEGDLKSFTRRFLRGGPESIGNGKPGGLSTDPFRPLAAFKGLAKLALSIVPEAELPYFEDALEWVSNPDHEYDARVFDGLRCHIHGPDESVPRQSWTALARRIEEEAPFPYMLFFLGTGGVTFQIAVPLCTRDDEIDGETVIVPRIAHPLAVGLDVAPVPCEVATLSSPEVRRDVVLQPLS